VIYLSLLRDTFTQQKNKTMKKIIALASLCLLFASNFAFAQKAKTKEELQKYMKSNIRKQITGTWTVTKMDGKLFIKPNKNGPEVEAPLSMWVGKTFEFSESKTVTVKDGNKVLMTSEYTYNDGQLSIPKFAGTYYMKVEINGSTMTMTQTPDSYYEMLAAQMKKPISEVKAMFRVAEQITFHLKR
jgi:hypothetical protein